MKYLVLFMFLCSCSPIFPETTAQIEIQLKSVCVKSELPRLGEDYYDPGYFPAIATWDREILVNGNPKAAFHTRVQNTNVPLILIGELGWREGLIEHELTHFYLQKPFPQEEEIALRIEELC
jgi:hypothetical protein